MILRVLRSLKVTLTLTFVSEKETVFSLQLEKDKINLVFWISVQFGRSIAATFFCLQVILARRWQCYVQQCLLPSNFTLMISTQRQKQKHNSDPGLKSGAQIEGFRKNWDSSSIF